MRKRIFSCVDALLGSRHALDSDEQGELVDAFQKLQIDQAGEWRCLWGCIIGAGLGTAPAKPVLLTGGDDCNRLLCCAGAVALAHAYLGVRQLWSPWDLRHHAFFRGMLPVLFACNYPPCQTHSKLD